MPENTDQLEPLKNLIKEWGISLPILAGKMGMKPSTFKNKYFRSGGKYDFTEQESSKLCELFNSLAGKLAAATWEQLMPSDN